MCLTEAYPSWSVEMIEICVCRSWCRSEEDTGFGSVEELVRLNVTNTKGQWEEVGCNNDAEDELMLGRSELKIEERVDGRSLGLKGIL